MRVSDSSVADVPEEVLLSLVKRLVPDPLSERPEPFLEGLSGEETKALERLAHQLNVQVKDIRTSGRVRTKLLERATELISAPALQGERAFLTVRRLGKSGMLRPSLYKISYSDDFQRYLKDSRVKRPNVEAVVKQPDSVQHIMPEKVGLGDFPAVSLLAKRTEPRRARPYMTLVQAIRDGSTLHVEAAWELYDEMVVSKPETNLVGLVQGFADRYGIPFSVPNRSPKKFIYYDAVPLPESARPAEFFAFEKPAGRALFGVLLFRVSRLRVLEIAMAYVIDVTGYVADLRAASGDRG